MATCDYCELEMLEADSCVTPAFEIGGRQYERIRFGSESRRMRTGMRRCGDCNATRGGLHHPGCDLEQCPACRGQALSCGCR